MHDLSRKAGEKQSVKDKYPRRVINDRSFSSSYVSCDKRCARSVVLNHQAVQEKGPSYVAGKACIFQLENKTPLEYLGF